MKDFLLDSNGDVVLNLKDFTLTQGDDLLAQQVKQVLSTNQGEWWLDAKEGIPIQRILVKDPNMSMIRDYIRSALQQVDKKLQLGKCSIQKSNRQVKINFTMVLDGKEIQSRWEA